MTTESIEIKKQLSKVDDILKNLTAIVQSEFHYISNYLRNFSSITYAHPEHQKAVHAVIRELQYFDLLHQKVSHVIDIHNKIGEAAPFNIESSHKLSGFSVFKLNLLQMGVAIKELKEKMDIVNRYLSMLDYSFSIRGDFIDMVSSFQNNLKIHYLILQNKYEHLQFIDVTAAENAIMQTYSTFSERKVMELYLEDHTVTIDRISDYLSTVQDDSSSVDLF
ncbi:hypothetical protein [Fulvivirga ligni]|uniref:hypothetical protein n=1 Tax=Fulvivirga ligni TaxID=2904246 RepID=UPI001F479FF7|nr:hypothetical protein [Fulvivirga ligni]UII20765.1 hypothetical protein LVD16_23265 [Fulvivirga ligni]